MPRFVILGIHQPTSVPGIVHETARVRMFPSEERKVFTDEDFELPALNNFTHGPDNAATRHIIEDKVNARMKELFK